jgi:hypothetical protein
MALRPPMSRSLVPSKPQRPKSSFLSRPLASQLVQVKDSSKDLAQLQRLNAQLEEARSAVAKMQQYESLYKESRMRSKQMQVEVATLQVRLAPARAI